jgi:hypothetical protein
MNFPKVFLVEHHGLTFFLLKTAYSGNLPKWIWKKEGVLEVWLLIKKVSNLQRRFVNCLTKFLTTFGLLWSLQADRCWILRNFDFKMDKKSDQMSLGKNRLKM